MELKDIAAEMQPRSMAARDWVFHILRTAIVRGVLPGGMQLKQDEISSALNVSHIPVREALRQLEAQGLVRIHPNRGASVSQLSRNTVLDMMEVRATLSVMKLRNSAPFLTEEDFIDLEHIIAQQKKEKELFRTEQLNYRFHEILGCHDDNSIADMFMRLVHDNIDRYVRRSFYEEEEHRMRSIHEHEQILAACRAGDFEKACDLLHTHIIYAKDYIAEDLV